MQYIVSYFARNQYEYPVTDALLDFLVVPALTTDQRVVRRVLHTVPSASIHSYTNLFGFETLRVRPVTPFTVCEFRFEFWVNRFISPYQDPDVLLPEAQRQQLQADEVRIGQALYLQPTDYTYLSQDARWEWTPGQPAAGYLRSLNTYIHQSLRFEPGSTHVHTTADEAWQQKSGVCQDYAHIFLALARRQGIPCRYVSGFLHPGPDHQGTAVMHAWVEAWIPGYGWMGLDPTNNILTDETFIKVAHGCDYQDCPPIKGVINTTGGQATRYEVAVSRAGQ
ncbi:MAG: transglutaminase family protein [Bacteroidia bacterium]|nr:transglutaminase family protein [Bacteroidia bacterium]